TSACPPSCATRTRCPSRSRYRRMSSTVLRSSSTTRTSAASSFVTVWRLTFILPGRGWPRPGEGALRVAPVPQLSDLTTYVIPSSGLAFIILSASAAVSGLGGGGGVGTLSSSVLIASATTFGSTPCALATSASVLPPCCSCL